MRRTGKSPPSPTIIANEGDNDNAIIVVMPYHFPVSCPFYLQPPPLTRMMTQHLMFSLASSRIYSGVSQLSF